MEITIEEVAEITVLVKITDTGTRVFACRFDPKVGKWLEFDVTDWLPVDEALRIHAISQVEREKYFYKLGREKKLWR